MEKIKVDSVASIIFAEVRVSADELAVYETALKFALEKLTDTEIERQFGANRDELEGICEDLSQTVAACKESELIAA